jgi:hypothetical protein
LRSDAPPPDAKLLTATDIEREFSERARHPITIEQLVQEWGAFAVEIGTGYKLGIYDYMNDLSHRDMLDEAISRVPGLAAGLRVALDHADATFRRNTEAAPGGLPASRPLGNWWWYRRPIVLVGELAEDFAREGPASATQSTGRDSSRSSQHR